MNPALPVDSSVSALRCALLQLDATLTNVARRLFSRRVALRHEVALGAMFVASRIEESTQWPAREDSTALQQQLERGDTHRRPGRGLLPAGAVRRSAGARAARSFDPVVRHRAEELRRVGRHGKRQADLDLAADRRRRHA